MFERLDHVATVMVNADHGIVCAAEFFLVSHGRTRIDS